MWRSIYENYNHFFLEIVTSNQIVSEVFTSKLTSLFVMNPFPEAVARRCSVENMFLEISQNSQENTCARVSFLIKLQASGLKSATLLKKRLWRRCFPVNFAKFLRRPFLQNTSGRLLLLLFT